MPAMNPKPADQVSVIVSTYCGHLQLRLVLLALGRQTLVPGEVLVADDGSGDETRKMLTALAPGMPFRLVHVWQPDENFRLARNRNNAIHHARGDILAMLDQDTLPHAKWLEAHLTPIARGGVGVGHILKLSETEAANLSDATVVSGEFEGFHSEEESALASRRQRKYRFYGALRSWGFGFKNRPSMAFGNASLFKEDLIRVNGFDEEYIGWGQEDDDLGRRLYMEQMRPIPLVDQALVSHIPHKIRRAADWKDGANVERYERELSSARCQHGLDGHPYSDVQVNVLKD
jgi:glycosyltransferase involved in cell wall biosynthesis